MNPAVGQVKGLDAARLRDVEEVLAASLADTLDVERQAIHLDEPVSDMGVDSIAAVQWTRALNARYEIVIPPTTLFDHPTVRAFARYVLEATGGHQQTGGSPQQAPVAPEAAAARVDQRLDDRIAIVGIAGQFPMARTPAELWTNLAAGRDCVSEIPPDRWPLADFYDPDGRVPGRSYCKWMGVLEGVDRFDPAFFSMSPAEAEWMDPQQRLFLQQSWACVEDAGLDPVSLSGARCGVFAGAARVDYGASLPRESTRAHRMTGTSAAMLSARVSYTLNLCGPCLTIDTASSSSLVAIAQACDSLVLGRSDLALAGGAAVLTGPALHIASCAAGMLSPQGRCFTFDARADGFVPAEAVGVVLLKRLDDAIRDGHHIHAVIRGWGINQDGKTNGITAPSAASQARLQKEVYEHFGIDPATISLIEAHGTGTGLGDPIEIDALRESFGAFTHKQGYCALGSAKASIGHALAAAGVVGVIKSTLVLKHRMLPPLVHFDRLSDHISLDASPFVVNTALRPWDAIGGAPRRVAVNGFGFGGTNAHVVLEEYEPPADCPPAPPRQPADPPSLIVLSARNGDRLRAQARQLLDAIEAGAFTDADLPDMAYTLQVGRHAMRERLGIAAGTMAELAGKLTRHLQGSDVEGLYHGEVKRHEEALRVFNADEDTPALIETWLRKGRHERVLELWVQGLAIDWTQLHRERRPLRVHLPTYPFAMERYWIPDADLTARVSARTASHPDLARAGVTSVLHPLVHRNTSTLAVQRFSSTFDGSEPFLADCLERGRRTMPAAAFLEMAFAACVRGVDAAAEPAALPATSLHDAVFVSDSPLVIEAPCEVHVGLYADEADGAEYEIYSGDANEHVLHAHGRASRSPREDIPAIDLDHLRSQCAVDMPAAACHELLATSGAAPGPALPALASARIGTDAHGRTFLVASLALPASAAGSIGPYTLHPSLLQGALHAAAVLAAHDGAGRSGGENGSFVPVALHELTAIAPTPGNAVAVIRHSTDDAGSASGIDIDLCDERGGVCVRLRGLSLGRQEMEADPKHTAIAAPAADAPVAATPLVSAPAAIDRGALNEKVCRALVQSIATLLRMKVEHVELETELSEFGFDSITLVALAHAVNQAYGLELTAPILFEHSTVRRLAAYLVDTYASAMARVLAPPVSAHEGTRAGVQPRVVIPEPALVRPRGASGRRPRIAPAPHAGRNAAEPLAVIGISGRFPGADDPESLWEALAAGRDCIGEIPPDRWAPGTLLAHGIPDARNPGTKWGGFINGLADFDPLFFGISPREAEIMDPQQRLILTYVWKVIEDAGYAPHSLAGTRTALFVGMSASGYDKLVADAGVPVDGSSAAAFLPSIGPNRASYFLDLRGPSEPIETACSSSLVALHRATLAFEADRCDLAIVGGVNTILNVARHVGLGKAGMLSPDGHCRTFSARANGYVRGEGVGMLLLKRLCDAERDGDHIYALIRSTAENHGGRSNSLTAPSPHAQTDVIKAAWTRAALDPRSVTYIEAHGTGTSLGDPIEINALKSAFKELVERTPDGAIRFRCGLGSVKTNIGHLEMAAGVAGLIKVILQMKHGTLAPTLHCQEVNPYIQLEGGPFYIVREKEPWPAICDADGAQLPRRAGVSSFGFGGVNAHVVLEEYRSGRPKAQAAAITPERPAIVVLSATSETQLEEQARNLLAAIVRRDITEADLPSLAFTLQVGREAMSYRLALTAESLPQLDEKLRHFLAGRRDVEAMYTGDCKRHKEALAFTVDTDMSAVVDGWLRSGRLERLLELWVKGFPCDWHRLYDGAPPRRISLPTYPFAQERCWVPTPARGATSASRPSPSLDDVGDLRHPLIEVDTSGPAGLRCSSTFSGDEVFIAGHMINGAKVLASAVQLELARAAIERLAGAHNADGASRPLQLRNVAWLRPLVATGEPLRVETRVRLKDRGGIGFEIATTPPEGDAVVHTRGSAAFVDATDRPFVDVQSLLAACRGGTFARQHCYEAFAARGLDYGPAFQAIETLHVGVNQVLGRLRLPPSVPATRDPFVLHPAMIDGALQCAMGRFLARDDASSAAPSVMFSLEALDLFERCPDSAWAWVRPAAGHTGDRDPFDVDVIGDDGRVCVALRGISVRPIVSPRAEPPRAPIDATHEFGLLTLAPAWEPEAPPAGEAWPARDASVVVMGGSAEQRHALRERYPDVHFVSLSTDDTPEMLQRALGAVGHIDHVVLSLADDTGIHGLGAGAIADDQRAAALVCFRVVKALIALGYESGDLGLTVLTVNAYAVSAGLKPCATSISPAHAAVHGLIGSLAKELRSWRIRLVDLDGRREPPIADLLALPADPDGNAWSMRAGAWHRQQLIPAVASQGAASSFVRDGVYVVIGGAGGVGVAFTEYLIREYQARVFWIGRRPEDDEIRAERDRLRALGPAPCYIACDATDGADLERARLTIKATCARIHGLVHAAVVIDGEDLARMDEDRFVVGFSAKAAVCTQVARVFAGESLESVLFFSSIQSFEKTPRHSYYAAGCAFADAFVHQLAAAWPCAVHVMNWGYWRGVTHVPLSASLQHWLDEAGMGTIERDEAFAALEGLLASPFAQLAFVRTTRPGAMQGVRIARECLTTSGEAASLAHTLATFHPDVPGAADVDDTAESRAELLTLLKRILLAQLQSLGLLVEQGPSVAEWKGMFGMLPLYDRWLAEAVRTLACETGTADDPAADVTVAGAADGDSAWRAWEAYTQASSAPYHRARATLIETMLRSLPDILCGMRPATDVMFPHASLALVEALYTTSRLSRYFNGLVADTVAAYIEERRTHDPSVRVRILEIGAGTGATSAVVLKRLEQYRAHVAEYCYTDISPVFLSHAERTFGPAAPFLRAQVFDVSAPPAPQGIDAGSYDLVIAANVLHATRRMRETLRHAKGVLKTNGWLIANELTAHSLVAHLTFGLLKGWWLYEDEALRIPGSPLLAPETWQFLLDAEGFRSITFPVRDARSYGQQVIVAESDGAIRQPLVATETRRAARAAATPAAAAPQAVERSRAHASSTAVSPRPDAHAGVVTTQRLTEHVRGSLVEELSTALKIDARKLVPDEPLANYGVDSIVAVQTVDVLNERFGIALTTTSLFDHGSIDKLTSHILSRYGAQIAATLTPARGETASTPVETTGADAAIERRPAAAAAPAPPVARWTGPRSMAKPRSAAADPRPAVAEPPPAGGRPSLVPQPIAIIGMSARFPNADSVEELWEALAAGKELTEEVSRWNLSEIAELSSAATGILPRGGFLRTIDRFDPLFFGISGLEATYMDPQQRLFLEEAWKALEDAGYAGAAIQGRRCGVYAGYNGSDYARLIAGPVPAQALWGNVASVLSARIAYHLDLQGPAITIDSACSSSLVSAHLACQALWSREIDCALAGGVYVQCTPGFLLAATRAGMLSPLGRCHTFDARADGFVPGEGVGVIMLKRLDEAIADGDHIAGVIRASGINQDGATSGITAPSAVSQERLQREVYERFGVRADQIQMVEAHGTGTKLGDPIEFNALTNAFRKDTDRKGFCALGSIKTNIGHTAAAAGIAGLIKVLLSLRHGQIPPSLHYERANPHIDVENSPFYVNTAVREWTVAPGERRRAAVSAFGLSGTNAHMVIEDGPARDAASASRPGYLIVISAQTGRQLREQVERLLAHCERHAPVDCGDVSHTLLTGRRHLAHRLAAIVRGADELSAALRTWLEKGRALQVYVGELAPRDHPHQVSLERYGNQCIATAREAAKADECLDALGTIADLYVQGYALDYAQLFVGGGSRRVPLPTYPFARDRYWIPATVSEGRAAVDAGRRRPPDAAVAGDGAATTAAVLHPLVHANVSDLSGQRYRSTFTGDEFFLADHVVHGVRVLSGMACLEMARAAVADARRSEDASPRLCLQHVAFARPLRAGEGPLQVEVTLSADDADDTRFDICVGEAAGGTTMACQGRVVVRGGEPPPRVDVEALRRRCEQTWSGEECYQRFQEGGLAYGAAHRGLERVAAGLDAEGAPFVLADIVLPPAVRATRAHYVLHPSVLDAALQGTIGFGLRQERRPLFLPFAVEFVDVFAPSPATGLAYVRERTGAAGGRIFDLDLCTPDGQVCVRVVGITARPMVADAAANVESAVTMLWTPQWQPQELAATPPPDASGRDARRLLFYAPEGTPHSELFHACCNHLAAAHPHVVCDVSTPAGSLDEQIAAMADHLLHAVQQMLGTRTPGVVLCQVIVPVDGAGWLYAAASALLRTAHLEDPKLHGQVIGVEGAASVDRVIAMLQREASTDAALVRYEGDHRYVQRFSELSAATPVMPWKAGGVYLITGGTGGLGRIFAREIATRGESPVIVLAGRSLLDEVQLAYLRALEETGARVEYHRVDVSSKPDVEALVGGVLSQWGRLDGILHCAGVLRDSFLVKKTPQELQAVLPPKVAAAVHLDEATRGCALDFFVTFSSVSSVLGAVGQADYALANAFLDLFANARAARVAGGEGHGRSVAINWPWWMDGGMQLGVAAAAAMTRRGLSALSTTDGLTAFYRALAASDSQVLVLAGQADRITALLDPAAPMIPVVEALPPAAPDPSSAPLDIDAVRVRTVLFLRKQFAETLQLPLDRLDAHAPLDQYGIDSVLVLQLTAVLEQTFGSLSKTLLFEYQTIDALAGYLLEAKRDRVQLLSRPAESVAVVQPMAPVAAPAPAGNGRTRSPRPVHHERPPRPERAADGIAVIGMSGRYPQARTLQQYWENLRDGKDCITEIPAARWDHERYFDEEKGKPGKTYTKWGGFIDGVDEFDPLFFNLSPVDAEVLDPQERLFLQCAYETIEDAGYTRETLGRDRRAGVDRSVGVFVGVMYEEYQFLGVQDQLLGQPRAIVGSPASVANRVSYFFNVHGPSLAVDTMCSSSLSAVHLACQSLRQGECDMAIAGGVNVSIHPNKYLLLGQGHFASGTGRCRSFGADADGYVPAEGVGAVLLKPLSRAIADGDQIHGVIKGTAINHGGKTNGYTVPNPGAQAQVITRSLHAAGINARTVSYLEAHGAGTALGDPIEIAALTKAFAAHTSDPQFCAIGSTKSVIGHAEGAAGVAALTKVLLQLRHGQLAPSLHAEALNPLIDFTRTPFVVQRTLTEWRRPQLALGGAVREYPRIAGISSFGAGGSNAHAIVEEYVAPAEASGALVAPQRPSIVVLSARSAEQLRTHARNLLTVVASGELTDAELPRIAFTLQMGREPQEHRVALLAGSLADLQEKLGRWLADDEGIDELYQGDVKRYKEALAVFASDEDLQEAIGRWVERGRYAKLLELWVKGLAVDWSRFYGDRHPTPLSLPTYPFLREKYWASPTRIPTTAIEPRAPERERATGSGRAVPRVLCKQWEPAPLDRRIRESRRAIILTTADMRAVAAELARRLPGSEVLDLHAPDAALRIPRIRWAAYDGWIDLAGCGEAGPRAIDWIALLQQWIEHGETGDRLALCVTRGLENYRNTRVNLAGAPRAGLYRMLQSEYRKLRSRHLDAEPTIERSALIECILAELLADSDEPEICYRDGERWRASLREIGDTESWLSGGVPAPFPADRVLWITGGTRGIGAVCAKHFVRQHGVKQLLLTGREVLPARHEWARHEHQQDALGDKIRAVLALEAEGAHVRVSSVPLTDETALRAELHDVRESMGAIGGILHCAGAVDVDTLAFVRKTPGGIERIMAPKVAGLDNVIACAAGDPVRFIVLFSSVSAIVPALGVAYGDYAAANAYMDYVATAYAGTLPIVSVQWGSWREAGFGEARSEAYRQSGLVSHSNAEGLRLLDCVVARRIAPVVMPVFVDAERWQPRRLMLRTPDETVAARPSPPRGRAEQPTEARATLRAAAEAWLVEMVAGQLKLDPQRLDVDTPLPDYGVDSVMLIQLLRPVGDVVGTRLDPSVLFEHSTIAAFARWLTKYYGDALEIALRGGAQGAAATAAPLPAAPNPTSAPDIERDAPPDTGSDAEPARVRQHLRRSSEVAVVGLACRLPGARNIDEYWQLLAEGRSAIRAIPEDRDPPAERCFAGLLDRITEFDPGFFLLSDEDARAMDPQALLILEESLNAWHHAGYTPQEIKGTRVGVFVGARSRHRPDPVSLARAQHPILALSQNYLAANVSRFFDLRGPSLVVDTACSSALVALQLATQALRAGDLRAALVGGISLLDAAALRLFEQRGILSHEPRFHLFDARARGAILGEGLAMVVLKTVEQAQADGDYIYAVIKAATINNDGRTASPTAPSLQAQREVMQEALDQAALRPADICHVEVSGSGSEVTDLLELKAIESIYRPVDKADCHLGSIKPNIGHPLSAEGIASFLKVVLMLHHRQGVPFLSAEQPMEHFDLAASPFRFSRTLMPLGDTALAAVNSFGDGGTNAHVILGPWTATQAARRPIAPPTLHRIDLRAPARDERGEASDRAPQEPVSPPAFWTELTTAG